MKKRSTEEERIEALESVVLLMGQRLHDQEELFSYIEKNFRNIQKTIDLLILMLTPDVAKIPEENIINEN